MERETQGWFVLWVLFSFFSFLSPGLFWIAAVLLSWNFNNVGKLILDPDVYPWCFAHACFVQHIQPHFQHACCLPSSSDFLRESPLTSGTHPFPINVLVLDCTQVVFLNGDLQRCQGRTKKDSPPWKRFSEVIFPLLGGFIDSFWGWKGTQ